MSHTPNPPILLTPGPLTTSDRTRRAMLRDWGSWDGDFNQITTRVRRRLLAIANAAATHECVPMQGSGTFSVEAAVGTLVPRDGHVLVPSNGAYCQRLARICRVLGRKVTTIDWGGEGANAIIVNDRQWAYAGGNKTPMPAKTKLPHDQWGEPKKIVICGFGN